ncbi:glycosyltransferase family 2 protein [Pelistega europaea]|uniref:Glycosyltransferase family 2 protein n=1 Tax=Pelistega europaea TaxID=106147 RepID=A0A7Y4P3G7_9BURK|nr:glycosyltransferase family 2 protein [Pelistega europaea]NOL48987.1 glycosyltransferase family 2 protein [Pelistega europaea]
MPSLCVAMIVKNEAQDLAFCLNTVKDWVDEIVILDSGSTDETEAIAKKFNAKFYSNTTWSGFGPQRQLAQSFVKSDYVLWLDADERVTPELAKEIQTAIQENKENTVYSVNRLSDVFGKRIHHSGWYPDYVIRLHKVKDTHYSDDLVHESIIVPKGFHVQRLNGHLLHYTYKNLHHYLVKSANYAKAWADQRQKQGKKASLWDAYIHAIGCFMKMYVLKAGFLDGKHGLLLATLSAHSTFVKYADLWVRNQQTKK